MVKINEKEIDASVARIKEKEFLWQSDIHEFRRFTALEIENQGYVFSEHNKPLKECRQNWRQLNEQLKLLYQQKLNYSERTIERCLDYGKKYGKM